MSRKYNGAPRTQGALGDKPDGQVNRTGRKWLEAGELPDPSTMETDGDNVVDLEQDPDLRASLEMAEKDKDVPRSGDEDWDMPEDPNTLHTRQVEEAQDPNSSAYWNGRKPFSTPRADAPLGEASMSEGERVQEEIERDLYKRGGADSVHLSGREADDKWYTRWINRLRRGRKKNKKGSVNPEY